MKYDSRSRRELLISFRDGLLAGSVLFAVWYVGLTLFTDEIKALGLVPATGFSSLLTRHILLASAVCFATSLCVVAFRIHTFIQARINPSHIELFSKLTENLPGMLYQYRQYPTGRGSVTYSSDAIRSIYEIEPEEAKRDGTQILDLVHPDDRDRIWASLVQSHVNLTPWKEEYRVILPRSGVVWRYGHARVERLPDGGTLWHGFVLDLTREKTAGLELAIATRKAEAANLAKSRFLAMMSHDIRTPMNGIMGFTTLLKDTPLQDGQREYVSAIEQSAESLTCLINDILDLSKIEAGQVNVEPQPFALEPCLKEIITILQPKAKQKAISLDLVIEGELPAGIEADRTRIVQILTNLLGNAVKFTDEGGVTLKVSCAVPPTPGLPAQWTLQVTDTGCGIPFAQQQRIFEPFNQIDGLHRQEGTGLGLTITRQLCQQMGGEVEVQSGPDQGTTFTATILAPVAALASPKPAEQIVDPAKELPSLMALVVDDHPLNAKLAGIMLRRAGCMVEIAHSANDAIALCLKKTFDVVFMDIQMPEISGLEATGQLRDLETRGMLPSSKPLYIVALTANVMPEDRQACLDAGMNDYLEKPLREAALREALAAVRDTRGG